MSKSKDPAVSNCEKKFTLKCLNEFRRIDGRAFDEFRDLKIEFSKDWGCCCVSLGKTCILAQVSSDVQQPKSSRPSEGILNVNVELNPIGALQFEAGRQTDTAVQLNRLLEKCIKDSKAVDLESLCIRVNEKVWAFRVDVNVLNHEGNLTDCASIAALSALAHFRRPDVSFNGEEFIVHTYSECDPIPTVLHHYPVCISYAIFNEGDIILADPTLLEENVAEAHLVLSVNAYKELCGIHLGGSALMSTENILKCSSKAAARANYVVDYIKEIIENDTKNRSQNKIPSFDDTLQFSKNLVSLDSLHTYLDSWNEQKKRKKKNEKMVTDEPLEGSIEILGKGSAAFLPVIETENDVWRVSEDEEDNNEVMIVEQQNLEDPIKVEDGESEEEAVVILNSDITKKKKRHRK